MKIDFIDNSATQYEHSANEIIISNHNKKYKLYFGDYLSASYLQLKHRNIKYVINGSRDMHGFSKEKDINYLNIDPNEDTKDLNLAYDFIDNKLNEGNVLVHGVSQGAPKILYYILVKTKTTLASALKLVRRERDFPNIRPNVVKYIMIKEKLLLGSNSVYLGGKGDRELLCIGEESFFNNNSNKGKGKKSNNNNGIIALFVVTFFVITIFGTIYLITGKI
jgi:hypothetical protein